MYQVVYMSYLLFLQCLYLVILNSRKWYTRKLKPLVQVSVQLAMDLGL